MADERARIIGGKFWLRVDHQLIAEVLRQKRLREQFIPQVRAA